MKKYQELLSFWFEELTPEQHFIASETVDTAIRGRFQDLYLQAEKCELWQWRSEPEGALAEIILLDQFSRNLFRGHADAFKNDNLALALAQNAVSKEMDKKLPIERRAFMYMPYMHSESIVVHEEAIRLFSQPGLEGNLAFEKSHLQTLKRFDRYPHRNLVLGRKNTPEEEQFLEKNPRGF